MYMYQCTCTMYLLWAHACNFKRKKEKKVELWDLLAGAVGSKYAQTQQNFPTHPQLGFNPPPYSSTTYVLRIFNVLPTRLLGQSVAWPPFYTRSDPFCTRLSS